METNIITALGSSITLLSGMELADSALGLIYKILGIIGIVISILPSVIMGIVKLIKTIHKSLEDGKIDKNEQEEIKSNIEDIIDLIDTTKKEIKK